MRREIKIPTKNELKDIHKEKTELVAARIVFSDGYAKMKYNGDCAGIQMKLKGRALIESQLSPLYNLVSQNNTLLIFSYQNLTIPEDIFRFYGELLIQECICVDSFGNQIQANIKKDYIYSEVPVRLTERIGNMSNKKINAMDNLGSQQFKYDKGIAVVPNNTFKTFLESMDREKQSREAVSKFKEEKKKGIIPTDSIKSKTTKRK